MSAHTLEAETADGLSPRARDALGAQYADRQEDDAGHQREAAGVPRAREGTRARSAPFARAAAVVVVCAASADRTLARRLLLFPLLCATKPCSTASAHLH